VRSKLRVWILAGYVGGLVSLQAQTAAPQPGQPSQTGPTSPPQQEQPNQPYQPNLRTAPQTQYQTNRGPSPEFLEEKREALRFRYEQYKHHRKEIEKAELDGVEVRIKEIARFRGVRSNKLLGYGLITGLAGTGDSQQSLATASMLSNALKDFGAIQDPSQLYPRNIAIVAVTAELPPFASPGNTIDITVQSIGDATSLQGGYLLRTPLYAQNNKDVAVAVAQGAISIGGFNVSSAGSSVQKNHPNVGRIPGGATVEKGVPTQFLFPGNRLFLELNKGDITTSQRIAQKINQCLPGYVATPVDGGTVQITLPEIVDPPVLAMSKIEGLTVMADSLGDVVVCENTGTIVMGGNVRLGPAVIAHGSLQVTIDTEPVISQPLPYTEGRTVSTEMSNIYVNEEKAQIGLVGPTTTVSDLAKVFQALKLTARDIIAILTALKEQGALKANVRIQ
jgi:flagellar P-ring protein precursor FlgI